MKLTCIRILYLKYAPHLSINVCTLIHVLKFHSMDTCPSKRCHWWLLFNHNWDDWLRWQAHFWDDSRPPIRHYWCSSPKSMVWGYRCCWTRPHIGNRVSLLTSYYLTSSPQQFLDAQISCSTAGFGDNITAKQQNMP